MAETYPDNVAALHVNMAPGGPPNPFLPVDGLSKEEEAELQKLQGFMMGDSAYAQIQGTRPQTLAVAMNDSPAGLPSWIIDKFHAWTDHGGEQIQRATCRERVVQSVYLQWLAVTFTNNR